ncbi:MAG: aminoacyl-tRNA deacylase [Anaerolineales bacterium]|jgi:prolyl-tRNA editing enzyme YbaK/EbsC (Cys-tRNA(Pro) deacylase)
MQNNQSLNPEHLARYMQENNIPGEILQLEAPTPTVESAAAVVGCQPDQIVKSLLFFVRNEPILAITSGLAHIERRAIAAHYQVGRKKVKLADAQTVLKKTGYSVGAMPPFGHLSPIPTLIDQRVLEKEQVYAGGGSDQALMRISPQAILAASQGTVMDLLSSNPLNPENHPG